MVLTQDFIAALKKAVDRAVDDKIVPILSTLAVGTVAAGRVVSLESALSTLNLDGHVYTRDRCDACDQVTEILGRPFGCRAPCNRRPVPCRTE